MRVACLVGLWVIPSIAFTAEVHPEVVDAVNWKVPENTCVKPDPPGTGLDVVDSSGVINRLDVDTYTLERYERQNKRWQKCLSDYKSLLLEAFERLKNSAQYGLTQEQANTILSNMAMIQKVLESPDGKLPGNGESLQ